MNCTYCNKEMVLGGNIYRCFGEKFTYKNIVVLDHYYEALNYNNNKMLEFRYYIGKNRSTWQFFNCYDASINNLKNQIFHVADLQILYDIKTVKDLNVFIKKIMVFS